VTYHCVSKLLERRDIPQMLVTGTPCEWAVIFS